VTYDPAIDRWSALPDPFNSTTHVRAGAAIASAGEQLLVWGGAEMTDYGSRSSRTANDGVRRGPDGTWKPMATERAPSARAGSMNAWTDRELVVWGGWKDGKPLKTGAAYDPATDTWRKFGKSNAPALPIRGVYANVHRNSVWSGRELWMWSYTDGHAFDPVANTWREIAGVPGRVETTAHDQVFVALPDGAFLVRQSGPWADANNICSAWRYDAESDHWRECMNKRRRMFFSLMHANASSVDHKSIARSPGASSPHCASRRTACDSHALSLRMSDAGAWHGSWTLGAA
jgi:hypothetical protein